MGNTRVLFHLVVILGLLVLGATDILLNNDYKTNSSLVLQSPLSPHQQVTYSRADPSRTVLSATTALKTMFVSQAEVLDVQNDYSFHVILDAETKYVQLIGITAPSPEMMQRFKSCLGKEAIQTVREMLIGKTVFLIPDGTLAKQNDRTTLSYVFLEDSTFLNKTLLRNGLAQLNIYSSSYTYKTEFEQDQKKAQNDKQGMWSNQCTRVVALATPTAMYTLTKNPTPTPDSMVFKLTPTPSPTLMSPTPTKSSIAQVMVSTTPTQTPLSGASPTVTLTPTKTPILTQTQTQEEIKHKPTTPTSKPNPKSSSIAPPSQSLNANLIFVLINTYRKNKGLLPFEKNNQLCALAASRGPELYNEIFGTGYVHEGLYNRNLPYWITENMAHYSSEEHMVNWWLGSFVHKAAIEGNYTYSCGVCFGNSCAQLFTNFSPK